MSHEVETMAYNAANEFGMFDNRKIPWHTLGTPVLGAMTSAQALAMGGLDYLVRHEPISVMGQVYPDRLANVRCSDNRVIGFVSKDYRIVQNHEAFAFTDELVGEGVNYETAGVLRGGERVFILANLPTVNVLKEDYIPYLCFTNSFDGSASIVAALTPVRVVCANTLCMALDGTPRSWSIRHTGNIQNKLAEARKTLRMSHQYLEKFPVEAEKFSNIAVYQKELVKFTEKLFPMDESLGVRHVNNVAHLREEFANRYNLAPDLEKHRGTAWGVYQAVSDMVCHAEPIRKTETYYENRFMQLCGGISTHQRMTRAQELLAEIAV